MIDTMKDGGRSAGAAKAIFYDCFIMLVILLLLGTSTNREANKV